MGFPAQLDPAERNHPSEDTVSHFFAREWQILFRIFVIASAVITIVTAITFWFWAFVPAVALLVSYLALVISNSLEKRTAEAAERHRLHLHPDLKTPPQVVIKTMMQDEFHLAYGSTRRETIVGWEILIGCIVGGFVIATILLPLDLIVIGAFMIFGYALFVMAPIWLGWLSRAHDTEEEEERARMKLEEQTTQSQSK